VLGGARHPTVSVVLGFGPCGVQQARPSHDQQQRVDHASDLGVWCRLCVGCCRLIAGCSPPGARLAGGP
jgi:hypothetical protein